MPVDVAATIAGFDALGTRMDVAARGIASTAAHLVQAAAMKAAPVGTPGNSTNAPGDLRRSIDVQGPRALSAHAWEAEVGPTTAYGRQRELGGEILPRSARMLAFTKFGTLYVVPRVYQEPEPYMKPALDESRTVIGSAVTRIVAAAIEET
ncbi:MAG TPA: hypothetical protein VF288_10860 [Mycobacteriales bacterium]